MKNEPTALPADAADAEDFDASAKALDRGQRARLIRQTRTGLGLSQSEFATRFRVPVGTLRDWEQGRFTPPGAVACLLRLLASRPELQAELAQPGA